MDEIKHKLVPLGKSVFGLTKVEDDNDLYDFWRKFAKSLGRTDEQIEAEIERDKTFMQDYRAGKITEA